MVSLHHGNFSTVPLEVPTRHGSGASMNADGRAVAVVDDDLAVCDSTRFLLELYDLSVRTYQSGADFLRDDPDIACLIVDYQIPDLNGLEIVSELRRRGSNVPAIMITAAADPAVERRAAGLGISQVLEKPLSTQALLSAIRQELE
jgi:two-component system, LuxR family, response regulator FixJ